MSKVFSSKKVLIPGVNFRNIIPLATLLSPKDLIVSLSLICLLAQISSGLKGVLESKEIQKLPSVKFYSKVLMAGFSSLSLTTLFSLSKTLGAELEILSNLSTKERLNYLQILHRDVLHQKVSGNLNSLYTTFNDPYQLLKFRKGVALQSRSIMLSTSVFLPHTLVMGLSIDQVDISMILHSSRLIWNYLSLRDEEFDFLLKKQANLYFFSKKVEINKFFSLPLDLLDSIRLLLFSELESFSSLTNGVIFEEDFVLLRSENNLTKLENDFKFIKRLLPIFPENILHSQYELSNNLIRVAVNQRKEYIFNLGNIFRLYNKN